MKKLLSLSLILCMAVSPAIAQDTTKVEKTSFFKRMQQKREEKERSGAFMITPLLGPGYTPELGFTIAGGILTSWRTDKSDSTLQRTSVPINIGYGTHNAFFINSKMVSFWAHDKLRVYMDVNLKNMDDNYFGVGYDKGKNTVKSDSTTQYTRLWAQLNPRFMWQFKKNFFAGAGFDINYTKGKDACMQVANDPTYSFYNDRPFNAGLIAIFQYDSRDVAVNAWKGMFLELDAAFYGGYLGGQNDYQVYTVDIRKYFRVAKPGQTITVQVKGRFGENEVPYGEMSQLGTPFDLRGYLWGQYRDKSMVFGIVEYRHKFYKSNGKPSMHGLVGWIAGGSIADIPGHMTDWLPNAGVGYRIEVQPRMNIRLDYGIGNLMPGGKLSHGFYFNFNEAF